MRASTLVFALFLAGLPGCTANQPADPQAPRSVEPSPVMRSPMPGSPVAGTPLPGGAPPSPGMTPSYPSSPSGAALPPKSPAAKDVALLQLIIDPADPLKLTDAEKGAVRERLLRIADANERVDFRKRTIHDAEPDLWDGTTRSTTSRERDAREAFLEDASDAEADLRKKAGGETGQAQPLPAHVPSPGSPPVERPAGADADDDDDDEHLADSVDLQTLGGMLLQMAERATPEQARKLLPEVASLQAYVKDLGTQYAELRKIASTPERQKAVDTQAAGIPWEDVDLSKAQNEAMDWADDQK